MSILFSVYQPAGRKMSVRGGACYRLKIIYHWRLSVIFWVCSQLQFIVMSVYSILGPRRDVARGEWRKIHDD